MRIKQGSIAKFITMDFLVTTVSPRISDFKKRINREIEYYRVQNENLKHEIANLEDDFDNNRKRLEIIKNDYQESEDMIRVMKTLTR